MHRTSVAGMAALLLGLHIAAFAGTIAVRPGDNLDAAIESASGGDIVDVEPGTYGPVSLSGTRASAAGFILVRKKPGSSGDVIIASSTDQSGTVLELSTCSYLVFENLHIRRGLFGVFLRGCDHIILTGLTVTGQGQEGISVKEESEYIDILNCRINDTGNKIPKYGEGIYLGSKGAWQPIPDVVRHIWIEGCEISDCGDGEAVDISSECFNVTVRNNTIHHIVPGSSEKGNMGAVYVSQYRDGYTSGKDIDHQVWIENNTIHDILPTTWPHAEGGVYVHGVGVYIVNNTISTCDEYGIVTSDLNGTNLDVTIYNNTISGCRLGDRKLDGGITHHTDDPGPNPNWPQSWYQVGGTVDVRFVTTTLPAAAVGTAYETSLAASGGIAPYTWSITSGSLDAGLSLTSDGAVGGTPVAEGTYTFSVTVCDVNDSCATANLRLDVRAAGEINLANGLTMCAHSRNYAPDNPVTGFWDGDTGGVNESGWPGTSASDTIWVEFDLGRTYDITTIRFFGDDEGTWVSETYTVEVKLSAQSAYAAVVNDVPAREARWFETQSEATARFVRLTVRGTVGTGKVQAREFEVYGVPANAVRTLAPVLHAGKTGRYGFTERFSLHGRMLPRALSANSRGGGVVVVPLRPEDGRGAACVEVRVTPAPTP